MVLCYINKICILCDAASLVEPLQLVVLYWPQWLNIILLETLWLGITLPMPVTNCPT